MVSELELDLMSTIARIEQLGREGPGSCGGLILHRLITCDARRLRGYLSEEAIEELHA